MTAKHDLVGILDLLPALDALLATRSVSRAAEQLGVGQPAMSRTLARLREALGDELLVRTAGAMVLTERAERLGPRVTHALDAVRAGVAPDGFDPATTKRRFVVATKDFGEQLLAPALMAKVGRVAPEARVRFVPPPSDSRLALESGSVDIVIDLVEALPASARRVVFLEDRLVVLGRFGHPVLTSEQVDLDDYCRAQHGIVRISAAGPTEGVVDQALAELGRGRRIVAELSTFAAVPGVAAGTDILFAFSEHLSKAAGHRLAVTWRPLPVSLKSFPIAAAWHERSHNDEGHRWLRSLLVGGFEGRA